MIDPIRFNDPMTKLTEELNKVIEVVNKGGIEPPGLTNLVNKRIHIDIMNPPSDTGLLPVTGLDADTDTNRLQAIFDWVSENQYTFNVGSLYTGYSYEVVFPTAELTFTHKIILGGNYLKLVGNRTIIRSTFNDFIFEADGSTSWNFVMEGFTFAKTYGGIKLHTDNLEAGYCRIKDNWFIDVKDIAVQINKQSSQCFIEHNKFHHCGYVLIVDNTDETYLRDNWISEKPRAISKDASVISTSRLHVKNNLFVPYPAEDGVSEIAYFNCHDDLTIENNHFGGEEGSHALVNCFTKAVTGYPLVANSVVVKDNTPYYNGTDYITVRLFEIPNKLEITNNVGYNDITKSLDFGEGVNVSDVLSGLDADICQVTVGNNSGQSAYRNDVPEELSLFTGRGEGDNDEGSPTGGSRYHDEYLSIPGTGTLVDGSFTIEFNKTIEYMIDSSYLVELSIQPHAGSGLYNSKYIGILSFQGFYNGEDVVVKAVLTPLVDLVGGTELEENNNVTVQFKDSGTDEIIFAGELFYATLTVTVGSSVHVGIYAVRNLKELNPL